MFKEFYRLTKPGIIYGNALPAIAGFLLASHDHLPLKLFVSMLFGLSFIIASGCAINNVFDKEIDSKMSRTKNRAIVTGAISKPSALIFAAILLILGIALLALFTNRYSLIAALIGWIVYVLLYTPLKHKTVYATLVGSIAGATPPVVGYAAVANRFDLGSLILFLILVFWQMPHFYAIAIRRIDDYASAGIPVLPIKSGVKTTKIQITLYIILFTLACLTLYIHNYAGIAYLVVALAAGLYWLFLAIQGLKTSDNSKWAKKVFLFSLLTLTSLCVIIPIDQLIKKIK